MKKLSIAVAALALIAIGAPASQAASPATVTFVAATGAPLASQTLSGLNPNGDYVYLTLGNFPTNRGLYIFESIQPSAGMRPTAAQTNGASEQWITNAVGGTAKPTDIVKIPVNATWTDCTHQVCGIHIEFDHDSTADMSQDQFFPITFAATGTTTAAATSAPAVTFSAQIDGMELSSTKPNTLNYEMPKYVVVKTSDGEPTNLSITADPSGKVFCTIANNYIKSLAANGFCNLHITVGSGAQANFPFMLAPGTQSLASALPATLKLGKSVTLATMTNFGEKISYTVTGSKNCSLKGAKLTAVKNGACLVKYSAPAGVNYPELMGSSVVKVSK